MAELIDMPFWMKKRVGLRNHVLDWGVDTQREGAIFRGCWGHSKALALQKGSFNHAAEGIIQCIS